MTVKAGYSTPMLHVADVARSLRFYALLGFETIDTEGEEGHIGWARTNCEGGGVMFLAAEEPMDPAPQAVLLYMYTPDLPALRAHLLASGVEVPPINYPEYMRSGEIHLKDPDGYSILVGHWGKAEHEAWEKRLAEKRTKAATQ